MTTDNPDLAIPPPKARERRLSKIAAKHEASAKNGNGAHDVITAIHDVMRVLEPLSREERIRVLKSASVFYQVEGDIE